MAGLFENGIPAVIRGGRRLFELQEVFDWIRIVHTREREKMSRRKIRALKTVWGAAPPEPSDHAAADPGRPAELYRGGAVLLDAAPYLPTPAHRDFDHWIEETSAELGDGFGMQAPGIECASWAALQRLQVLLGPTLRGTGPRSYRYNAFLGSYRKTPFGYHLDPHHEAVFQYVVHGSRRVRFWDGLSLTDDDADWVEDSNDRVAPPLEAKAAFDLEPGDLVFWPGTYVHGFEMDGRSLALSMVIDRTSPRNRADIVAGLEILTSGGRAALPPIDGSAQVARADTLTFPAFHRIGYERYDDELIVGVCGRTFEWPDRVSIGSAIRLIEVLNCKHEMRERISAARIVEQCADEHLPAEEVWGTLGMLKAFGFLRC